MITIDIDCLKPYIEPIDKFDRDILEKDINESGRDVVFARQMLNLDCSRIKQNYRLQQTISYSYVHEITRTLYLIQQWFPDKINDKLKEVLTLHNKNIEFEKLNPPIVYGGKKYKNKYYKDEDGIKLPRRRSKQTKIKFDENGEPVKTVAERKLAEKAIKLNTLKFNFKHD